MWFVIHPVISWSSFSALAVVSTTMVTVWTHRWRSILWSGPAGNVQSARYVKLVGK